MQHEAEYPPDWMPNVIRSLPKQVINVVSAGTCVAEMKEAYANSLQILMSVCGLVLLIGQRSQRDVYTIDHIYRKVLRPAA